MDARVVVITGAAKGIGHAVSTACLRSGWAVVGVDVEAAPLKAIEQQADLAFIGVVGDVATWNTHELAADAAEQLGRLRGWVNNAGIEAPGSAHNLTEADLRRIIDVNLIGTAFGCAVAVRRMLALGPGSIVVSSIHAVVGFPGALSYQAAKGGVEAVTRQIEVEYGPRGIRCNAVQPGAVWTPLTEESLTRAANRAEAVRRMESLAPLGRIAEAREVASVVRFLLDDASSFVTGVSVPVDGGATAGRCSRGRE